MPESHAPESAIDNPQGQHSDDLLIPPNRPFIPHLRSDAISHPHTLEEFREAEGRENRKRMLLELWKSLPEVLQPFNPDSSQSARSRSISSAEAESLKATYDNELLLHCAGLSGSRPRQIEWTEFKKYAQAKETGKPLSISKTHLIAHHVNEELWHIFHNELDLDGNGQIDEQELQNALSKSGK